MHPGPEIVDVVVDLGAGCFGHEAEVCLDDAEAGELWLRGDCHSGTVLCVLGVEELCCEVGPFAMIVVDRGHGTN